MELGSSLIHATGLYSKLFYHQCISKGKEIWLFSSINGTAFKELLMLMSSSSICPASILPIWKSLKEKKNQQQTKKINQSPVFAFKKQVKVLLEITLQVHSCKWKTSFEEWFSVVAANRSALWADYNGNPRTDTNLSSFTWVYSALEYSNNCLWTLKYAYGVLPHFYSTALKCVVWRMRLSQERKNKMNPRAKKWWSKPAFLKVCP